MDFLRTEDLFSQLECFVDEMVDAKKRTDRRAIAQIIQRITHTLYLRMVTKDELEAGVCGDCGDCFKNKE